MLYFCMLKTYRNEATIKIFSSYKQVSYTG